MIWGIFLSIGIGIIFAMYKTFERKTSQKGLKNFFEYILFEDDSKLMLRIESLENEIKKLNKKIDELQNQNIQTLNQRKLNQDILEKMRKGGLKLKEISNLFNIPYHQLNSMLKKSQKEVIN